jgi:hypothetical protein
MNKLVCSECRHENEPERIYCHNCGARLDRSSLAKERAAASEAPAETLKRMQRMFDPRGIKLRRMLVRISKLILGACAAAAIIEMLLPPQSPPRSQGVELGPQIGLDMETAVMEQRGARLSYSEDQVNAYLLTALKRKQAALSKPLLEFERGFAGLDEGVFRLTTERSFLGYSFYITASYQVETYDGKLAAKNCGGSIGRMPIHPQIMKYADVVLDDVWKALDQDRKQVAKLAAIEFHPHQVVLTAATQ